MRLQKIVTLLPLSILLASCGDDSAGTKVETIEKKYESVNDLPECADSLSAIVATIDKDRYICISDKWRKIDGYVKGACNLDLCNDDFEGMIFYANDKNRFYQCGDGNWKNLDGKKISDADYIDCALNLLVKYEESKTSSLRTCDKSHDGELARVESNLYACSNKAWVKLSDEVISEGDLPECAKDGRFAYVLNKMKAYECVDGEWVDEKTSPSESTDSKNEQSSESKSVKSSSSATAASSSSEKVEPVKPTTSDTTKIRGICLPSESSAEKGTEIQWEFINMGGTPVSLDWQFSGKSPEVSSSRISPKMAYSRGGIYKATLVVNKGLPSESDEIVCSNLNVIGTEPISGCECNTDISVASVSEEKPFTGVWTVSGCEGAAPFTYEWGSGVIGDGEKGTATTTTKGNFSPFVTIYNDDGLSMSATCKSVLLSEPLKAECEVSPSYNNYYLDVHVLGYADYSIESLPFKFTLDDQDPIDIRLDLWGGFLSLDGRIDDGKFHSFTIEENGDTVCTGFSKLTCYADNAIVEKDQKIKWSLSSLSGFDVKSADWTFTDPKGVKTTSDKLKPENSFADYGSMQARVVINKGTKYEHEVSCAATIPYPEVNGCVCGEPELVSESNDLAEVESVEYSWAITGCQTGGGEGSLRYEWDRTSSSENERSFTYNEAGEFSPYVLVYNDYDKYMIVRCNKAEVVKTEPESSSAVEPESSSDVEPESSSADEPESSSDVEPESSSAVEPESSSDIEPESSSAVEPESSSDFEPESSSDSEENLD